MSREIIRKKESKSTRRAKKSHNHNQKRKFKLHSGGVTNVTSSKIYAAANLLNLKMPDNLEDFCKINNLNRLTIDFRNAIRINHNINFFDDAEAVLRVLLTIMYNAKYYRQYPTITCDSKVPFGTLYFIDNMCYEISRSRPWEMKFVNLDPQDRERLSKMKSFASTSYDDTHGYMINEKVAINRSQNLLASQLYKQRSKAVTDMINQAYRENGTTDFQLSLPAYQAISSAIGEHFDNILQHAPRADYGYLCGYLDRNLQELTILIFNFGKTIYETLSAATLPAQTDIEIKKIIKSHTTKGYFSFLRERFTPENAMTLLALQEGISSRLTEDPSRGHGLIDFIDHCFSFNEKIKIAFISGNTAIKVDNTFSIKNTFLIDRLRRTIAFNAEGDLYKKPDSLYVKHLGVGFPGLIIETKIPLPLPQ